MFTREHLKRAAHYYRYRGGSGAGDAHLVRRRKRVDLRGKKGPNSTTVILKEPTKKRAGRIYIRHDKKTGKIIVKFLDQPKARKNRKKKHPAAMRAANRT
jgi:hypothetical protein